MHLAGPPTGNAGFLDWLRPLIDGQYTIEALIAIASVSVVVWTAGFVVRTIGHRPGRGLVVGMNYAQLAFMGALVAAFLTPIALQAVALMFLIQSIWTVTSVIYVSRLPFNQRTFGQQQALQLLDLAEGRGYVWYLVFQGLYIAAIVTILVWPSRIVALPLLWLALYGSYQILTTFLYQPTNAEQAASTTPTAPLNTALVTLIGEQNAIQGAVDSAVVANGSFANRQNEYLEAKAMVRSLQDAVLVMSQFEQLVSTVKPGALVCSGYVHGLIAHRAATARLFELAIGEKYMPQTAMQLIDELRPLAFYDHPSYSGLRSMQFVEQNNVVNLAIRDSTLDTIERSYSLSWLGNAYYQEASTALLVVVRRLASPPPNATPTQPKLVA